jgi:drug/metabolite transporter (DMT)-like permease
MFFKPNISIEWIDLWKPCLAAFLCWLGQIATLIALERGDVSIATPVLGLKILFVVFGTAFINHQEVPTTLWIAAFLSVLAVVLLQSGGKGRHHHVLLTVLLSGSSALCYGMFDIMTTRYREQWGLIYLPIVFGMVLVASFFIWLFRREKVELSRNAKLTLWFGIVLFGVQMMLFTFSVSKFGDPARNNIVYNVRGLWSVLAVWFFGHWYNNTEQYLERSVLIRRLIGAGLMLAAVFLAFNP